MLPRIVPLTGLLFLSAILGAPTCGTNPGTPLPPASIAVNLAGYTLTYDQVASQRISRTIFEYTYSANLTNLAASAVTGAQALVSSAAAATVIVDGSLAFGDIAAGQTVPSSDTFAFQQDRTVGFVAADLAFQVTVGSGGPGAPSGLTTVVGSNVVYLAWAADPSPGAAYHVYRSQDVASGFTRLSTSPLAVANFSDRSALDGQTYFYAVTTEIAGSESALSEQVGGAPPHGGSAPPPPNPAEAKLKGGVLRFQRLLALGESVAAAAAAAQLWVTPAGLVTLEAVAANRDGTSTLADLQSVGADAIETAGAFVSFRLPVTQIAALGALASIETVLGPVAPRGVGLPTPPPPVLGSVTEGAVVSGALDLQARQITDPMGNTRHLTGEGVKIAIFDVAFVQNAIFQSQIDPRVVKPMFCPPAWTTVSQGPGPVSQGCLSSINPVQRYNDSSPLGDHGTAVAEIVTTLVPDADLYLYAPESQAEARVMVLDAIALGVDVITSSMALNGRDFWDGTSPFANELNNAGQNAVVTVAMGNEQEAHYAERFAPDGRGFHQWDAAQHGAAILQCKHPGGPDVPCLGIQVFDGETAQIDLSWDQWASFRAGGSASDLRIHVYDLSLALVASTAGSGIPYAGITTSGSAPPGKTYETKFISVELAGGPAPQTIKVDGEGSLEDFGAPTSAGRASSISVSSAVGANVLGVGATIWGSDFLRLSSSLGPAIGEGNVVLRNKPDITGPTIVSSQTDASGFFAGTSAAAPHVAGAAALLIDYCRNVVQTGCSAAAIRTQLEQKAFDLTDTITQQLALPPNDPELGDPIYATLADSVGAGRVDVSPPLVFSSNDDVIARDPVDPGDVTNGRCDLATGTLKGHNATVSADGTMVAFEGLSGNFDIFTTPIDACGGTPQQMTFEAGGNRALMPAWSPDGTQLAYIKREFKTISGILNVSYLLEVIPATGGSPQRITTTDIFAPGDQWWAFFPHWSPDGQKLLFTLTKPNPAFFNRAGSYQLAEIDATRRNVRLNISTGAYTILTPGETDAARGRYSPDGSRIAYVKIPRIEFGPPLFRGEDGEIRILERATGTTTPLIESGVPLMGFDPAWSPSGTRLVYASHLITSDLDSAELFLGLFRPNPIGGVDALDPSILQLTDDAVRSKAPAW